MWRVSSRRSGFPTHPAQPLIPMGCSINANWIAQMSSSLNRALCTHSSPFLLVCLSSTYSSCRIWFLTNLLGESFLAPSGQSSLKSDPHPLMAATMWSHLCYGWTPTIRMMPPWFYSLYAPSTTWTAQKVFSVNNSLLLLLLRIFHFLNYY